MNKTNIFIDGSSGTVGLQINERLKDIENFNILKAPPNENRVLASRQKLLNEADIVILCLPEEATKEAVGLIDNPAVRILDASSTHRVTKGWDYGLPELAPEQPGIIAKSHRVANPGCFATGAILLLRPLIDANYIPPDYPLSITGVGGYTAGGKRMIAWLEGSTETCHHLILTNLNHRHVPEICVYGGLKHPPLCMFSIANFPRGMVVQIPLALWALPSHPTAQSLHAVLAKRYQGDNQVNVHAFNALSGLKATEFDATFMAGSDNLDIYIAHEKSNDRVMLVARFDNLGKGASGAALRNLQLMTGSLRAPRHHVPLISPQP